MRFSKKDHQEIVRVVEVMEGVAVFEADDMKSKPKATIIVQKEFDMLREYFNPLAAVEFAFVQKNATEIKVFNQQVILPLRKVTFNPVRLVSTKSIINVKIGEEVPVVFEPCEGFIGKESFEPVRVSCEN